MPILSAGRAGRCQTNWSRHLLYYVYFCLFCSFFILFCLTFSMAFLRCFSKPCSLLICEIRSNGGIHVGVDGSACQTKAFAWYVRVFFSNLSFIEKFSGRKLVKKCYLWNNTTPFSVKRNVCFFLRVYFIILRLRMAAKIKILRKRYALSKTIVLKMNALEKTKQCRSLNCYCSFYIFFVFCISICHF